MLLDVVIMRALFDAHREPPDDCSEADPPPSQRLTFDVAAIASVAGLHDSRGNVPLDFCMPVRTSRETPATITCEEIYVLLYVDGATSLAQIAEETSFSLSETISIVLGLVTQGIITFDEDTAPRSQKVPKVVG